MKAVRWTALSAFLRGSFQLLQLSFLARLLLPGDFGLAATTIAIAAIGSLVADLGLNSAYLRERNIENDERSALYWLNVFFGLFLTLFFISVSPFVAAGLDDPRIAPLLKMYALVFLIVALGQQLRINAEKQLAFRRVAINEVLSTFLGVSVTLLAAYTGSGAASIIYGAITTATANTALAWLFLSNGWRPLIRVQLYRGRRFISFGLAVVGNSLVSQIASNLDMLIGARLLGANQFGLYAAPRNFFMQVLSLINPIVTRVGFPIVAHLDNDREQIAAIYEKTIGAVIGISAPIYFGAFFFAEPLVMVLFGVHWIEAVPSFRLLALWALMRSVMNPIGSLLYGMGRPWLAFKWNLVNLVLAVLVIPFVGFHSGFGLSAAVLGLMLIQIFPGWYFLVKPLCGMPLNKYLITIVRPATIAVVSLIPVALITQGVDPVLLKLGLAATASGLIYLFLSWLFGEVWLYLVLSQFGIELKKAQRWG